MEPSTSSSLARRVTLAASLAVILATGLAWLLGRGYFDGVQSAAFYGILLALCFAGLVTAVVLGVMVQRAAQRAGHEIVQIAKEIGEGRGAGVDLLPGVPEAASRALQSAATQVQQRIHALETELHGLNAVLSAMEEGLVVVDSDKRLLMVNAAARKILNLPEEGLTGRDLSEIARQNELLSNITLSLEASQTASFEFQVAGKRHVLARCSPYRNNASTTDGDERQHGAVAVLHDISELRRLERVRTEFVANVSHELRTPLTSLLGYLETLSEDAALDAEESRKFLQICRRQAERLSRIVEDLLRLSRLENPQQEIAATEIDLAQVVNTAVDQCRERGEERRISIETQLPDREAVIFGDRGLLVQALSNLIENAINYNREGGRVTVRLRSYPGSSKQWEISVEDTGIGIPSESLGRIFERFYRVDKARSREGGGTGLGLSIVRHIALAHGASVHVESVLDKGSTFSLRFKARERSEASWVVHGIN